MMHFGVSQSTFSFSGLHSKMSDCRFSLGTRQTCVLYVNISIKHCASQLQGAQIFGICHFGGDILSHFRLCDLQKLHQVAALYVFEDFFVLFSLTCMSYKDMHGQLLLAFHYYYYVTNGEYQHALLWVVKMVKLLADKTCAFTQRVSNPLGRVVKVYIYPYQMKANHL